MKKKFMTILLTAVLSAAMLSACGSESSGSTSGSSAASESAESAANDASEAVENTGADLSEANIAVFYYTYADTYISSVRTALDSQFDALGVTYQNYDGNNNQTTQNEQIDTALSQGANILIVNVVTSGSVDTSQAIVDKAAASDAYLIFFNRAVEDDDTAGQVLGSYDKLAFVGTDAPEAGHMQGEMIGNYLIENYDAVDLNGDGVISYAMMMGQLGNAEAIYRTQYSVEDANAILVENGYPELEYFDSSNSDKYQVDQDGAWSATAANNYMTTNLSQYNETNGNMIELVICNNDGMAEGVITALNVAGYNLGTEDSTLIPVFGVDATDAAKQLIADGMMVGTIMQDADGMASCIGIMTQNAAAGAALTDGTDSWNADPDISNKIYIPYGTYTGE